MIYRSVPHFYARILSYKVQRLNETKPDKKKFEAHRWLYRWWRDGSAIPAEDDRGGSLA
jgi:hypothetical protein